MNAFAFHQIYPTFCAEHTHTQKLFDFSDIIYPTLCAQNYQPHAD
jgi:hypothetical protein